MRSKVPPAAKYWIDFDPKSSRRAAAAAAMTIVHFQNAFFSKLQWSRASKRTQWLAAQRKKAKVCTKYHESRKRRPENTNNKNDVGFSNIAKIRPFPCTFLCLHNAVMSLLVNLLQNQFCS